MQDRCAILVRTSTAEQSVESQFADVRPYAERRGWEVATEISLEGGSAYRGGMDAFLACLARQSRQEGWSILLVHSIDRLSRGGIVQVVHAVTRLADAGVRLASYREADMTDLSSPHGELVLSFFAWLAMQESVIKSERAKRGIEAAKVKGAKVGRPPGSKDRRPRTRRHF